MAKQKNIMFWWFYVKFFGTQAIAVIFILKIYTISEAHNYIELFCTITKLEIFVEIYYFNVYRYLKY